MSKVENIDVRTFVSKEVFAMHGQGSWQFVSDNIVKLYLFTEKFFNDYYKAKDLTIEKVVIVVNDYHTKILGGIFNNRGLRTVKYINDQIAAGKKTAVLSQHIGGSTNAQDINVVIYYKGGRTRVVPSNEVYDTIVTNEKVFMEAGLTTLENKTMTSGWTHMDCRFTGLDKLYIVNP